jgi:hypothetical protein
VCGKRWKAFLPILLPALERNGHLKLDEQNAQRAVLSQRQGPAPRSGKLKKVEEELQPGDRGVE